MGKPGKRTYGNNGKAQGSKTKYSAKTKSFVSGKIAGQYQARGFSKSRAQYIGNAVVNKMHKTFQSGKSSTKSYAAGVVTGQYQERYGYSISKAMRVGNTTVRSLKNKQITNRRSSFTSRKYYTTSTYVNSFSKYGKNYDKTYR